MTIYLAATAKPPSIVCPSWCEETTEWHLSDLENWGGKVIHSSGNEHLAPRFVAAIMSTTTTDGVEDPRDPRSIHIRSVPDLLSLDEAIAAGKALIALAEEASA